MIANTLSMLRFSLLSLSSLAGVLFSSALAAADVSPTPTPLPKSGNLGSSLAGGSNAGAPGTWGNDGVQKTEDAAPIAGSVSKVGNNWIARVFNNSSDIYSADIKVAQLTAKGSPARSDYFSVSLKPGQSAERSFSAALNGVSANLELTRWKKTSVSKPAPAANEAQSKSSAPDVK